MAPKITIFEPHIDAIQIGPRTLLRKDPAQIDEPTEEEYTEESTGSMLPKIAVMAVATIALVAGVRMALRRRNREEIMIEEREVESPVEA